MKVVTKIFSFSGLLLECLLETFVMKNQTQSKKQDSKKEMSNTIKDPEDWTTGDEEMTGAQRSYLKTLSEEAGEEAPDDLTKAEASKKIDSLQEKAGRGK